MPLLSAEDPYETKKRKTFRKTFNGEAWVTRTRMSTSKKPPAEEPTWFGGLSSAPEDAKPKVSSTNEDAKKVANLLGRFPHHSETQVNEALAACEGHAGRAAKMLEKTPVAVGLGLA